jgi:hypothetical protein
LNLKSKLLFAKTGLTVLTLVSRLISRALGVWKLLIELDSGFKKSKASKKPSVSISAEIKGLILGYF